MNPIEKRAHPRSEYFLIQSEGQPVPVYAFRNAADTQAIPALVMDMSEGGVQVLTTQNAALEQDAYGLEIVTSDEQTAVLDRIPVAKVWQRRDGLNIRTGFAFHDQADAQSRIAAMLSEASHHLLRCVLHPAR